MVSAGYRFDNFVVDRRDERLVGPLGPVRIGNKAFRVLLALLDQEGRLLTKDELFSSVWDGTHVSEAALTTVVKELRRALGDTARPPRFIEAVYGRGYRFVGQAMPLAGLAAAAPPQAPQAAGADDAPPVILVSAFEVDAVRERFPHLASGLREEVISALARFSEIQLIADSRPEAVAESDRRFRPGRDFHLTATLVPDEDGVKVIARAKGLGTGHVVWAEAVRLPEAGTAAGVERIVRRIIGCALPAVDEHLFRTLPHGSERIYDRYLRAKRTALVTTSFHEARQVAASLENIILESPDFALAYPPLIRLYNIDFNWTALGSTGPEERSRALALGRRCAAIDRSDPHAHTVLGFCHLWHRHFDAAEACLERAVELNPYNPARLNEAATGLMFLGAVERADHLFEQSRALNPFPDDLDLEDQVQLAFIRGRYDEVERLAACLTLPRIWGNLYPALAAYRRGDEAAARPLLAAWRSIVVARWRDPGGPDEAALLRWIADNHPFRPERLVEFLDLVCQALSLVTPPAAMPGPLPLPGTR